MRIYIIGNDGITLCREPPATVNKGEVAVASREELHAARLSKNDRMSASRMKFTFLLLIPTITASSASCWLRPGRNPYHNPRQSSSVDRAQPCCRGPLDDLVLQRRDREWALAAVFLRNVTPTGWQRPIRSAFDPCVQVLNPAIEVRFVGLPRHPVDAGRGGALHR